MWLRASRLAM